MADGILTQITMAGGAINLVYNTIITTGNADNNANYGWNGPQTGELLIIYYSTSYHLLQPVIITHEQYNSIVASMGANTGMTKNIRGYYYEGGSVNLIQPFDVIQVYSSQYAYPTNYRNRFIMLSNSYFMIVGNS